jgi:outer membrane protein assembly factor BamB
MSQESESSAGASPSVAGGLARAAWFPLAVVVLTVLAVGALEVIENVESFAPLASRLAKFLTPFLCRVIVIGSASIAILLWFVLAAPAGRATRLSALGIFVLVAAILSSVITIDGFTGDVVPRWRFRFAAPVKLPQASHTAIDFGRTSAHDYPQYLGTDRRATVGGLTLATDWVAQPPQLLWRQPIGAGWSSFAVVGAYAVTQEQRDQDELVTCYEVATGRLCWSHATPARFYAPLAGLGPRATPTVHDGRVYALGALGSLACLEGATGKSLWTHDIVAENGAIMPQWGKSCSPLVYQDMVIVSAGGRNGKSLVAYDADTGEVRWAAGDDASSYSSPTVLTLNGQPRIVIVNERYVTAHDPADGRVLWKQIWPDDTAASPNVSQPLAVDDQHILLSKGYGVGSALWKVDSAAGSVEELWRANNMKTKFTNAVLLGDHAFGLDEGVLSCLEVRTGKKTWKKGKYGHGQVLLVGELLLVQSEKGDVALVKADPRAYRELTRFVAVSGQSWNCPALAGNRLLVRTDQEAACYELPTAEK